MSWWDFVLQCVWEGAVMNHHNTMAKHAMSLILDCVTQFFQCVAIDICIGCGALRQEFHKQNAFSVPKHCAHDLPSWTGLPEFRLCCWWSVPQLHGLLIWFRGFIHNRQSATPHIIVHIVMYLHRTVAPISVPPNYSWHVPTHVTKLTWISAGFMFFAFKKRITDRISHVAGFSTFLNIINTQHDAKTIFECLWTAFAPSYRINKLGTHVHHRDSSAEFSTFANWTYFQGNPRIW